MPDLLNPAGYPPVGFLFSVEFVGDSGKADASFQEVSGISSELGTEEIGEGGENRFKHQLPLPAKHSNLVLKRGLLLSGSTLTVWCKTTLESDFNTPIQPKTIGVSLVNAELNKLITWQFIDAWPIKWSLSNLNSMENTISVETIEFTYKYFRRVSVNPQPVIAPEKKIVR